MGVSEQLRMLFIVVLSAVRGPVPGANVVIVCWPTKLDVDPALAGSTTVFSFGGSAPWAQRYMKNTNTFSI